MNTRTVDGLAGLARVVPQTPTRTELLDLIARAYEALPPEMLLDTFHDLEDLAYVEVRALPIGLRNVLSPAFQTLWPLNLVPNATAGAIMDCLKFDDADIHAVACACHDGSGVRRANDIGAVFREVARGEKSHWYSYARRTFKKRCPL